MAWPAEKGLIVRFVRLPRNTEELIVYLCFVAMVVIAVVVITMPIASLAGRRSFFPVANTSRKSAGRGYLWLGLVFGLLGPVVYASQVAAKRLSVPWYIAILSTVGTLLVVLALLRARTISRILAAGLLGLLASAEWYIVSKFGRLPAYAGPLVAGQPFPAFTTTLADGARFTQTSLKGEHKTVMVFFRGRW
jgi:hypothetical protein